MKKFILIMVIILSITPLFANYVKYEIYFKNNVPLYINSRKYNTPYLFINEFVKSHDNYIKSLNNKYNNMNDIERRHNTIIVSNVTNKNQEPSIRYLRRGGKPISINSLYIMNTEPTMYFNQNSHYKNNKVLRSPYRGSGGHNSHRSKGYSAIGHSIGNGLGGAAGAITGGSMGGMMGL